MPEQTFVNPSELDSALASLIVSRLRSAINARGEAFLVISGGGTPKGLFARLAVSDLAWERVTILLADERWVTHDHIDCNERMVREHLLVDQARDAQLLSLIDNYPDTTANLAALKRQFADIGTFDVVILGMGLDGHTASLFPDAPELVDGLKTAEPALMTSPKAAPHARISLSRQRLNDTRCGVLHIVGEDKRRVLREAVASEDHLTYPILNFLTIENPFTVFFAP